eukprot:6297176-Ditylum_brightwellii.AAC.1
MSAFATQFGIDASAVIVAASQEDIDTAMTEAIAAVAGDSSSGPMIVDVDGGIIKRGGETS